VITLVRVDNRLIHGQVVEAWLPYLKVSRVVVADDEAAESPLVKAAMGLAVQGSIQVDIQPLNQVDYASMSLDSVKTLVLVRDINGAVAAKGKGLHLKHLNVGNVHFSTGRKQVAPSVFLSPQEVDQLTMLAEEGADVEVRAVPSDKPLRLDDIRERSGKA
jgi:mannose/fructose/N-acetylgalactosamine-specific phosphotransferase system component IIB